MSIGTDTNKLQEVMRTYLKTFYSTKLESTKPMGLLGVYGLPKLNQDKLIV